MKLISAALWVIISFPLLSQSTDWKEKESDMAYLADVMVNAEKYEHRKKANTQFYDLFKSALQDKESLNYPFESIEWVSKLSNEDDELRVISWQLRESDSKYHYFAFIQWMEEDYRLVELKDKRPLLNGAERMIYQPNTWYGALYYGLLPLKSKKGKRSYLILGYDGNDEYTNNKIADMLIIDDGSVSLGSPVFEKKTESVKEVNHRVIHNYADGSIGNMKYDAAMEILVFDHTIPLFSEGPNGRSVPVSDGSYEAYKWKGNKWVYEEKVFDTKVDEPPMDQQILENRKEKDLFGRKKKN